MKEITATVIYRVPLSLTNYSRQKFFREHCNHNFRWVSPWVSGALQHEFRIGNLGLEVSRELDIRLQRKGRFDQRVSQRHQ